MSNNSGGHGWSLRSDERKKARPSCARRAAKRHALFELLVKNDYKLPIPELRCKGILSEPIINTIMSKIATREYYAHKNEYDQNFYAYPVEGHPELTSLRRRTTHAGNQPGAKQVNRIGEISRAVKNVMDNSQLRMAFHAEWIDYCRRRKVSHRDPYIYKYYQKTYSTRTLRDYVRTMFYVSNHDNQGPLKIPTPTITQ